MGDYPVGASTDDILFSSQMATLTYYDPSRTAQLTPAQQLAIGASRSGFFKVSHSVTQSLSHSVTQSLSHSLTYLPRC